MSKRLVSSCHGAVVTALALAAAVAVAAADDAAQPVQQELKPTQRELMSRRGYVRHDGAWRTAQEIELLERAERARLAEKDWNSKLARLRRQVDEPAHADRAAEEIREIVDPAALPALAAAVAREPSTKVRGWYVEAVSRIRSADAVGLLIAVALDHADPETRITACERLVVIGPQLAVPTLVAALGSADNAQVNRAAEALRRLGSPTAIVPLIDALETQHLVMAGGDGTPEGSTTATFTPSGGGLSMGGGAKRARVTVRNDGVLEALVQLTGANFAWDAAAWRAWLAVRNAPPSGLDLRRG
ncbi:MAG: HEAT repeat domain-containing protein [Planctomycetaceae bacterium]